MLCELWTCQPLSAPTFICNNCSSILRCFNNDKNIGLFSRFLLFLNTTHIMCILWPDFLNHLVMDSVYFQDKFHSKVSDYESSFVMKIFNYFSFLFFLIYHCEDVSLPAFYIFPWLIEVMKTIWSFFFTQFCILNNWFSCIYNIFSDAQNPHITSFDACKYSGITFF